MTTIFNNDSLELEYDAEDGAVRIKLYGETKVEMTRGEWLELIRAYQMQDHPK